MVNNDIHIDSAIRKLIPYRIQHEILDGFLQLTKGDSGRLVMMHGKMVRRAELNRAIDQLWRESNARQERSAV